MPDDDQFEGEIELKDPERYYRERREEKLNQQIRTIVDQELAGFFGKLMLGAFIIWAIWTYSQ